MIDITIYRMFDAGSSNDELRSISKEHDVDLDELWTIRARRRKGFERGVAVQRWKYRQ